MSAEVFIDTNVFIYHLDATDPRKHAVAEQIVRDGLATGNACISFQVVQECLNTATRKAEVALDTDAARSYMDTVLIPLLQVPASAALYHRALDVRARWQFSFYDALIVAAALAAGCSRLISEDLQHGQRVDSLTIHNPFRA
ncbi:MAG: twitching motility protein PilT [Methylibium sp. NZG]|nr:MAG: twitching motility protein PilT [Methylibium sp. NZG]